MMVGLAAITSKPVLPVKAQFGVICALIWLSESVTAVLESAVPIAGWKLKLAPNDAEMVSASLVLSNAHAVKAVESDTEIEWSHVVNGLSGVYINLDTLDGESEVRFTVTVRTDTMSLLKAEFSASSKAPDPDSTNNLAAGLKYPLYELEFGEWSDCRYTKSNRRLYRWFYANCKICFRSRVNCYCILSSYEKING